MATRPLLCQAALWGLVAALAACADENVAVEGGSAGGDVTPDTGGLLDDAADAGVASPDTVAGDTPAGDDAASASDSADAPVSPDTSDAATKPICPGAAGCKCEKNSECDAGFCIDTADGKVCAQGCTESCPAGFTCKQFGGADSAFVCVPHTLSLCAPCKINTECAVMGVESYCIDYGSEGRFCGAPCKADADCPDAYECLNQDVGAGKVAKQCKRKAVFLPKGVTDCDANPGTCGAGETCVGGKCGVNAAGVCECSKWAKNSGLSTECSKANAAGTCKAARKCGADGLEACAAKEAKAETCNLEDDNCDGSKDNLPPDFKCAVEAFKAGGSAGACKADAECSAAGEACDEKNGKCQLLIGKCSGVPLCANNGELVCDKAKTPKEELCNGEDDDCDGDIDEDFGWTTPNDPKGSVVPLGKACGLGPCAGGKVKCKALSEAFCDTDLKAKPEDCDGVDNDCDGLTDDLACDDASFCTKDLCEAATGKCTHEPANECDDKDQCSSDTCNPKTGKCIFEPFAGACDDGNKCTVGDACKKDAAGKLVCTPGADPAKCDDANLCTDDSCDGKLGCVNLANAATQVCYSADPKTKGIGLCLGGLQFCKDSKLQPACVGEVVPTKKELCDGEDDTCDGKVDEGCAAVAAAITFSAATLTGKTKLADGSEAGVLAVIGPTAPVGAGSGEKNAVWFGFLSWIKTVSK